MGRVIAKVRLTNLGDLVVHQRKLAKAKPRSVEVEALVDTGATELCLRPEVIRALGLKKLKTVPVSTVAGLVRVGRYEPVHLELLDRDGNFDVVEVPAHVPNLLGQIPLEHMDLVVDPKRRRVIPNPEHGGVWTLEMYASGSPRGPRRKRASPSPLRTRRRPG
jgi:predicted aspartyl protease